MPLRPKSFDVLVYLVQNPGRLASKAELIENLWQDVIVTDNSLVQCIKDVRQALQDDAQTVIETVSKRGYLFASDVVEIDAREAGHSAAVAAGLAPDRDRALPLPDRPSIAVLPFDNLSGDPDQDYLADGISEDLLTGLSRIRWLFAIARNSSFAYRHRAIDVRRVARELGVRYVLEGSVRRFGNRLRISAQLIDAMTGGHHWPNNTTVISATSFRSRMKSPVAWSPRSNLSCSLPKASGPFRDHRVISAPGRRSPGPKHRSGA